MLRVLWTPPAEKDLHRLTSKAQKRIVDAVDRFRNNRSRQRPSPHRNNTC